MGLIRSALWFLMGTGFGIYAAQNYKVPNIKKFTETGVVVAKQIEETYRKPSDKSKDGEK